MLCILGSQAPGPKSTHCPVAQQGLERFWRSHRCPPSENGKGIHSKHSVGTQAQCDCFQGPLGSLEGELMERVAPTSQEHQEARAREHGCRYSVGTGWRKKHWEEAPASQAVGWGRLDRKPLAQAALLLLGWEFWRAELLTHRFKLARRRGDCSSAVHSPWQGRSCHSPSQETSCALPPGALPPQES